MSATSQPLKGVVLGAGYFSQFHLDAWNRIPEVAITAIGDLDKPLAEARMKEFGIPNGYTDYREMLDAESPDFIDIVTPPATHLGICREAARRGVHILCQKPLSPTYAESERIVSEVRRSGVRFMVNDNWRWQPWYRELKNIITDGVIGDPTYAYFQMRMGDGWGEDAYLDRQPFFRDYERLLIFETGVHFIDTFRYLFGEIVQVYACLARLNPAIRGEDAGQVMFHFASGMRAFLDANRYNENDSGVDLYTCHPRNTFGILRLDGMSGHVLMDSCGDLIIRKLGKSAYHHDYARELRGFAGDSCYLAMRHFVDGVRRDKPFETNGEEYLQTLRVVEACYESADSGLPVAVGRP